MIILSIDELGRSFDKRSAIMKIMADYCFNALIFKVLICKDLDA